MPKHLGGRVLALALLSLLPATDSLAQAITRQITLVVPYSAGGGTDTVARLIGNQMSRSLGQPVIIENVVGAGGTLANQRVARAGDKFRSVRRFPRLQRATAERRARNCPNEYPPAPVFHVRECRSRRRTMARVSPAGGRNTKQEAQWIRT